MNASLRRLAAAPVFRAAVLLSVLCLAAPSAPAAGPGGPPPVRHRRHHPPPFPADDPVGEFYACLGCALAAGYLAYDVGEALWYGASSTEDALRGGWTVEPPVAAAGRSPFAIGLDARFEAPGEDWDVSLLRLGLVYTTHRDVSGIDVNLLLGYASGDEAALQVGLFNVVEGGFDGFRAGLCNVAGHGSRGVLVAGFFNVDGGVASVAGDGTAGAAAATDLCAGLQIAGFGNRSRRFAGLQIAGFVNRTDDLDGLQIGLVNVSDGLDGVQVGLVNVCGAGAGFQLGLWNHARSFAGVQVGLCNVISESPVPFLPLLNASF